jgi:MOSC domain-containing protein YiiM
MPRVIALYAGRAGSLATSKGTVRTAIAKTPVARRARVGPVGLAGDEQISPGHGGPDRALACTRASTTRAGRRASSRRSGEHRVGGRARAVPELAQEWRVKTAARLARAA